MSEELKNCPFCGGKAHSYLKDGWHDVMCGDCCVKTDVRHDAEAVIKT